MNNKKCPKCGYDIVYDIDSCPKCGEIFKEVNHKKVKDNKYLLMLLTFVITLICSSTSTFIICSYMVKDRTNTNTIFNNKNVTINDTGIAEAVSKVYDSVVVVETFVKDNLYATGTGFVFKEEGDNAYILTNYHVIENGTNIKVIFTNDEEVDAEVSGSDAFSDIAVLKVDKKYITSIAIMGSSASLRVGDTTFAVGAPLDATTYSWSVTRGILSGKDRVVEVSGNNYSSGYVMEVLQTDTAINSGNSGGPLCNANGEVIGITNMKIASSSIEGMGFAIPIEIALEYAEHFIKGEPITRPYLGISMYDLSNNFFSRETGIYIKAVEKDSPAYKAGLQQGDIIIKIDGKEVLTSSYLQYELYKHKVGDEIEVTYTRNGKEQKTKVILGSYDITT